MKDKFRRWKAEWWPQKDAAKEMWQMLIFSRLALVMTGWIALGRLPWGHYSPTYNVTQNPIVLMWIRWDAMWYTGIASHGYWFQALAFFPMYPFLTALVHWLTFLPVYDTAIIVANLGLIGFSVSFYGLVNDIYGEEMARRSLGLAILFPTAFYLSAAYTEGIFMFFSLASFWLVRRGKFLWAGLFGMFAALTRNEGVFLTIPFVWGYYQTFGFRWRKQILPVLFVPIGIVAYMIYQTIDFHSPIAFIKAQAYWGRHITWPWIGIFLAIKRIAQGTPLQPSAILSMIDLVFALSSIVLWVYGWIKKLPIDWLLYWGILLLIDISAPSIHGESPLLSMSRLVLILFPMYVVLGMISKNASWNRFFQWIFPGLQFTFFVIFATWHWIA